MNIFCKLTLQGIKKNRTRTLVTVAGVALSAALFTAVSTFGVSLLHYMIEGAAQKYGGWHVGFLDVPASFVQEQAGRHEVAATATFENIGYAALDGGKDPAKPYLFVAGFSDEAFQALPLTLVAGRMPENSGEVLVPGSVAANGGVALAVGDVLSLSVGNRRNGSGILGQSDPYRAGEETLAERERKTYRVVGICQTPAFETDSAPGYTLITGPDTAEAGESFCLFVTLKQPRGLRSYLKGTAGSRAYLLNTRVLRFMGLSDDPGDSVFTVLLFSAGAIVIAIIMLGSIFLIYNSFRISLNERTRQFGILASVGATARQLRSSVLFEGLCVGALGIPVGALLGLGSTGIVISAVARNFQNILYAGVPLTLKPSLLAVVGAAGVSMATILISAYVPARKAARTPVMESIRQTNEIKVEANALRTPKLAQSIFGFEGTLALKNIKRNRNRYRSVVLSLVLSIVLFIATSSFVAFFRQTAAQAKVVTDYDIGFGTHAMDNRDLLRLYDRLKGAGGVYESSYQFVMDYSCGISAGDVSDAVWESAGIHSPDDRLNLPVEVQFLDDHTYLGLIQGLDLPADTFTGQNANLIAVAKRMGDSGDAQDGGTMLSLFAGPSATVTLSPLSGGIPNPSGARRTVISLVELVPPDTPPSTEASARQPYFFRVMAPYSLMEHWIPADSSADLRVKGLTFRSYTPSETAAEMATMIQDAGLTGDYLFFNTSELLDESRNYVFIANVFSFTFLIMISLIAVANVFNTISTNLNLRRRELAMLRSIGISDHDFNNMMRLECAFLGIKALLVGLPVAASASWLIYRGMYLGGADGIRFALPWTSVGISVLSVLLVVFISMIYALGKIKKENILDALRDDMA